MYTVLLTALVNPSWNLYRNTALLFLISSGDFSSFSVFLGGVEGCTGRPKKSFVTFFSSFFIYLFLHFGNIYFRFYHQFYIFILFLFCGRAAKIDFHAAKPHVQKQLRHKKCIQKYTLQLHISCFFWCVKISDKFRFCEKNEEKSPA